MIPFSPGAAIRAAGPATAVLLGAAVYAGELKGRAVAAQALAAADRADLPAAAPTAP